MRGRAGQRKGPLESAGETGYGVGMKRVAGVLLPLLLFSACKRGPSTPEQSGMTKNQFIAVFTQLQQARAKSQSAAEFAQRKQEILQKAGVSERNMQQFVKANVQNVTLLADMFDTISNRLAQPTDTTTGKH
jgi:hypothetical protein